MKMFMKVTPDYGLIPVQSDDKAIKYIYNRKVGQVLSCEVKQVRSYENLQRFMVFINMTFDMQEFFDEKEVYRYYLTMKAGFFDTIVTPAGKTIFKTKSLAFENMPEEEFREVFSSCIDVFLKDFGNGQTEEDILNVIGFA
jgi:hypothetical protein